MADIKITDLTAYTDPVSTDVLPIVDVGNDLTKKVSIADLLENAGTGSAAAPSFSFDGDNDTGMYRSGTNALAFTTAGSQRLVISSSGSASFSADVTINSLTVGRGAGNISTNTAAGYLALGSNTTGVSNTANGYASLYNNTTGYSNTANGVQALFSNTTGASNTANGYQAFYSSTTGTQNTANGYLALYYNTTGSSNVADGHTALFYNTTGSGNIGIGFVNNAGSYAPVFDPTTENNRIVLGHTAITDAYVQVAWTVVSDARDKMNFAPVPYGLDFVNQLKPTAYQFKVDRDTETPNGDVRYGFKAQDILALEGDNPVIIDTEDADNLKYKGEHLVPVLVNAVQELTAMVKELKAEVAALKGA